MSSAEPRKPKQQPSYCGISNRAHAPEASKKEDQYQRRINRFGNNLKPDSISWNTANRIKHTSHDCCQMRFYVEIYYQQVGGKTGQAVQEHVVDLYVAPTYVPVLQRHYEVWIRKRITNPR